MTTHSTTGPLLPSAHSPAKSATDSGNQAMLNKTPALIFASILSSVLLILSMKTVLSEFHFPFVLSLSACHFLATTLFTRFFQWILTRYESGASSAASTSAASMPTGVRWQLAVCGTASIVFMNANLHLNSVGFYQLSKLLCIPYMVTMGRLYQQQRVSLELLGSLVGILFGVGMATVTDFQVNALGSLVGLIAVISTAQFQLWQGSKQAEYGLNAVQITGAVMPFQFLVCFVCAVLVEMIPWTPEYTTIWTVEMSMSLLIAILWTCFFAIAVNIVTYALIGKTSAVTYQVVGHLKTILTLIGGYYLFSHQKRNQHGDDEDSGGAWMHLLGIFIAMIGMVWYGDIKSTASTGKSTLIRRWFPDVHWSKEF